MSMAPVILDPLRRRPMSRLPSFGMFLVCAFALAGLGLPLSGLAKEPKAKVVHSPRNPVTGTNVTIILPAALAATAAQPTLQYQVVEPGAYIETTSGKYRDSWKSVPPKSIEAGKDVLFEIPADVQRHRRLVRYRFSDGVRGAVFAPGPSNNCPNYAYFVYDGVPAWKGSIKPGGAVEEFSSATLSSVQTYHLIATKKAVEESQWHPDTARQADSRHAYAWTGTLVGADGTVYDNIRFRARGGVWRHAMGKNMWKFDFNKGHGFRAQDNWGKPYESKWSKLNLGACIQQGDYGMRGEQGLFESVGFRLFNLAGLPSPHTHFVHFRVITGTDEQGKSQYDGDFWGLYMAVENIDSDFVEEHALPDQSVFKVDGMQPHWGDQGGDNLTEADARQFVKTLFGRRSASWWRDNVDLPGYYNYRSILECIHHYDVDAGKNYFFRRDPVSKKWWVVPWDIDLTWGDRMYGWGNEPFIAALRHPEIQRDYLNRLREVRDLLFNPEQTGALIDEYASIIGTGEKGLSFAEADRRKWDCHPVMSGDNSRMGGKSNPGIFYSASRSRDFAGMVRLMKNYVKSRSAWIDSSLLSAQGAPAPPTVEGRGDLKLSAGMLRFAAKVPEDFNGRIEWRLGEISTSIAGLVPRLEPRRYEITTLWSTNNVREAVIPAKTLEPGRTYRVRARVLDSEGNASHYSDPVEFTAKP